MKDNELKMVIADLTRCDRNPDRAGVYTFGNAVAAIEQLFKERNEAIRERDDARRELCIGLADHTHSTFTLPDGCLNQLRVERARGWDCFKEETQ